MVSLWKVPESSCPSGSSVLLVKGFDYSVSPWCPRRKTRRSSLLALISCELERVLWVDEAVAGGDYLSSL